MAHAMVTWVPCQGVSTAAGMALAGKKFTKTYRVYAPCDGEIEEGLQVSRLPCSPATTSLINFIALLLTISNRSFRWSLDQIITPQPIDEKFKAFKFHVIDVADGHVTFGPAVAAFAEVAPSRVSQIVIAAHTVKGQGCLSHGEPGRLARQGSKPGAI